MLNTEENWAANHCLVEATMSDNQKATVKSTSPLKNENRSPGEFAAHHGRILAIGMAGEGVLFASDDVGEVAKVMNTRFRGIQYVVASRPSVASVGS